MTLRLHQEVGKTSLWSKLTDHMGWVGETLVSKKYVQRIRRKHKMGTAIAKSRKHGVKLSVVLAVIFILFGSAINLVPLASFYFGRYNQSTFQNEFSPGTSLTYYGYYGIFVDTNNSPYAFGIKEVVTDAGNGSYSLQSTIYLLNGTSSGLKLSILPKIPFYGSSVSEIYDKKIEGSKGDIPFVDLVIPNGTTSSTPFLKVNVLKSNTSEQSPTAYLGYPYYYNSTIPEPNFANYVLFGSQYVMANLMFGQNFSALLRSIYNSSTVLNSSYEGSIFLASGNAVPQQDWLGWVRVGFEESLPVNAAFLLVGAGLLVFTFRRMR